MIARPFTCYCLAQCSVYERWATTMVKERNEGRKVGRRLRKFEVVLLSPMR